MVNDRAAARGSVETRELVRSRSAGTNSGVDRWGRTKIALGLYASLTAALGLYLSSILPIRNRLPWALAEGLKETAWLAILPWIMACAFSGWRHRDDIADTLYFAGYLAVVSISLFFYPPSSIYITLAVLRNTFLYSIPAYFCGYEIARSDRGNFVRRVFIAMAIAECCMVLLQFVTGIGTEYATLRSTGSIDERSFSGGMLSYIELSAVLNFGLCFLLAEEKPKLSHLAGIILISVTILICNSRLGACVALLLLFIRFPRSMLVITVPTAVLYLLAHAMLHSEHRLFIEGFETPRTVLWLEFVKDQGFAFLRHQYGFWGGAVSAGGSTPEAYVDSSIVAAFLQGGIVGIAFVLYPIVRLLIAHVSRHNNWFTETGQSRSRHIWMLIVIVISYCFFFNFIDGWPGNFLSWFVVGSVIAANRNEPKRP